MVEPRSHIEGCGCQDFLVLIIERNCTSMNSRVWSKRPLLVEPYSHDSGGGSQPHSLAVAWRTDGHSGGLEKTVAHDLPQSPMRSRSESARMMNSQGSRGHHVEIWRPYPRDGRSATSGMRWRSKVRITEVELAPKLNSHVEKPMQVTSPNVADGSRGNDVVFFWIQWIWMLGQASMLAKTWWNLLLLYIWVILL